MSDFTAERYRASSSLAGLSASIFVIGALIARFVSAQLMEKIGKRNVLILAVGLEIFASVLYFWASDIFMLLIIRVLHGFSYGMASTAVSTIVTASIAKDRNGEGIGYFMLSITLGAAIGPFFGMFLIQHGGYRYIFAFCTVAVIICLLAAIIFEENKFEMSENEGTKKKIPTSRGMESIFEIKALAISFICAGIYFCYSSIISFLTPYSSSIKLETSATFFFIVYSIVILITRPFTGRLFDRKGAKVTMLPAFLSFFFGMILLSQAHNGVILLISAAFLGFGIGVIQSCGLAVAVQKSPADRISYANSTFYIFLDIGTGIGPFFLGFLIPFMGYRGMYLTMAFVSMVFGIIFILMNGKKEKL